MSLISKYILFAVFSILVNLGCQELSIQLYHGHFALPFSVLLGTIAGMVVKYALDKRYIFYYRTQSLDHETHTFALYVLMSVATTLIFWSFEFSFHWVFQSKAMRYVGAILGLSIGYGIKFFLDRTYVFVTPRTYANRNQ